MNSSGITPPNPPTPPSAPPPPERPPEERIKTSALGQFFILKPVFATLLALLLIVGGWIGYGALVKESNPDIDIAVANVQTFWPGADPETIEQQVTNPLEDEITSVENVKQVDSASYSGVSVISVEFTSEADTARSIQLLRDAVSQAEPELPREAEKPSVKQVSFSEAPILTVALYGDLDQIVLGKTAEVLQEQLEGLSGVNEVDLGGDRKEVIQVQLDPVRLTELSISPRSVANAITDANTDFPLDELESDDIGAQLRFYGRFRTLEDLRSLPITRFGDITQGSQRIIRLGEIAQVRRELEAEDTRAFFSADGAEYEPVISLSIKKVPGQDSLKVIETVLTKLDAAKQSNLWPQGLDYRIISNDADVIWEELSNLSVNAVQATIAVFVVLFVALSWREALIAGLSIPLSFLGAITVLWLTGQTINIMVLIGMVLALGLLVDVFILMMEGMHEAIFVSGLSFSQAALKTVKTYAPPAFAGQLTTILALAPLMAITGFLGKFIRLLPVTTIICLVMSFIIAVLIDIPISRYLLGNVKPGEQQSYVDRLSEKASHSLSRWTRNNTIRNRWTALAWSGGAIALFVAAMFTFGQLAVEFFPQSDGRTASINIELPPTTTLDKAQIVADDVGELLREKPYFASSIKFVGQRSSLVSSGELVPNQGSYLLGFSAVFTPENERENYSFEYLDELRDELNERLVPYPGAAATITGEQAGGSEDPIQIELRGSSIEALRQISGEVQLALRQIPGSRDVRDNLGALQPDLKFLPKREVLDFYNLTESELAQQARYYTSTSDLGDFPIGGNEEDLAIQLSTAWPSRRGGVGGPTRRDELLALRFFGSNPALPPIPATAVVDLVRGETPLSITHRDGERTVTVLAKVGDRTLGEILGELEPKIQQLSENWPEGITYSFGGESEEQAETFGSAGQAMIIAFFLVFAVLVLQLQSFRQPVIIMMAIPFSLIGTIFGFYICGIAFSFTAFIGIISLVGIVVNDAIVMVDTMNAYRAKGLSRKDCAARGVADRLRPILTTSVTTIAGLIPLAFSDPVWLPLASAIIFGLMAATVSALLIVPCLYLLLTPKTAADVEGGAIAPANDLGQYPTNNPQQISP